MITEDKVELIDGFKDNRTLDEIIQEVADEECMTFEETKALFKKGLREANNFIYKIDYKAKAKKKEKRKQAKKSRRKNR